jgi:hypothetical protein
VLAMLFIPFPSLSLQARQDEIVVQDIILPFGERESKLWSIPDGVSPEIRGRYEI